MITNETSSDVSIPIAFDGGNNAAFYIVGGSPMIRDTGVSRPASGSDLQELA